jgi:hypothetical protein
MELSCNAWTGAGKVTGEAQDPAYWALQRPLESGPKLLVAREMNLRDWRDPKVGWGVVLAENATIPTPIKNLIAARKAAVFRYLTGSPYEFILLRNYDAGKDIDLTAAPRGMAPEALPFYLLIVGSPDEVPWRLQYILSANRCVGRLPLTGKGLENYVNALLADQWPAAAPLNPNRAVIWAVDHGEGDITHLMRNAIAAPLADELHGDDQLGAGTLFLDGSQQQTHVEHLHSALRSQQPGLIVTTSHGMTAPLNDPRAMALQLGLPVDSARQPLSPQQLLNAWQPGGAIWYAHACCSAGGDRESHFTDLFSRDSPIGRVLAAVATVGGQTAPLAIHLLGAENPLRAFIGHVEPTFDWTLQQRATGQFLTASLIDALYGYLYVKKGDVECPVGYAFREWYLTTNGFRAQYNINLRQFNSGQDTENILLALQLAARDIESTVILGDPTVAMPGLT